MLTPEAVYVRVSTCRDLASSCPPYRPIASSTETHNTVPKVGKDIAVVIADGGLRMANCAYTSSCASMIFAIIAIG